VTRLSERIAAGDTSQEVVEAVKAALRPLVSDGMDQATLDAWLTDLANAAIAALLRALGE